MATFTKKEQIDAFVFTGDNYDELLSYFPQLKKYEHQSLEDLKRNVPDFETYPFQGYTVGWDTESGFTEALPGFYLVNHNGAMKILEPHVFHAEYE